MKNKLVLCSLSAFMATMLTGCAGLMGESMFSSEKGRILISADEAGMRAFSDMYAGAIIEGKGSPDTIGAHTQLRREQEVTTRQKFAVMYAKPTTKEAK